MVKKAHSGQSSKAKGCRPRQGTVYEHSLLPLRQPELNAGCSSARPSEAEGGDRTQQPIRGQRRRGAIKAAEPRDSYRKLKRSPRAAGLRRSLRT
ncbi:hypothetical protein AOLI_G00029990 [Acnodon oligacanthus]